MLLQLGRDQKTLYRPRESHAPFKHLPENVIGGVERSKHLSHAHRFDIEDAMLAASGSELEPDGPRRVAGRHKVSQEGQEVFLVLRRKAPAAAASISARLWLITGVNSASGKFSGEAARKLIPAMGLRR